MKNLIYFNPVGRICYPTHSGYISPKMMLVQRILSRGRAIHGSIRSFHLIECGVWRWKRKSCFVRYAVVAYIHFFISFELFFLESVV